MLINLGRIVLINKLCKITGRNRAGARKSAFRNKETNPVVLGC